MTGILDDILALTEINERVGLAESAGDKAYLEGVLASEFAFRRADGMLVGRTAFMAAVSPSAERKTAVEHVELSGGRAVVTCVVRMTVQGEEKAFHNLRLFVKTDGGWKLLGWANERQ